MIHPHLKTDEELLAYWQGDFHDKDQMQALEQLARRKIGSSCDKLKKALADEVLYPEEIRWTYFEYIYDNQFVIEYVNNPKQDYNVDKAIFYIERAIPDDFSFDEYGQLSKKAKDALLKCHLGKLKNFRCDFEEYVREYHQIPQLLESFDDVIRRELNNGYVDYLRKDDDSIRLMTIDNQIEKLKEELHISFIEWLYRCNQLRNNKSYVSRNMTPSLFSYDYHDSILLKKLRKILESNQLSLDTMPNVYISFEIPMSFKLVEGHDERDGSTLYDTEKLLGYYIPAKQEIRLLELGIQFCAKQLHIEADLLREIVFIHELGHYMQHKMPCYQTKEWDDKLYNDSYSPKDLHEGWAQLMDAWVVKDDMRYSRIFDTLVAKQSAPYQVFKNYIKDSQGIILKSLDGLRQLGHPATIKDWDELL